MSSARVFFLRPGFRSRCAIVIRFIPINHLAGTGSAITHILSEITERKQRCTKCEYILSPVRGYPVFTQSRGCEDQVWLLFPPTHLTKNKLQDITEWRMLSIYRPLDETGML